MTGSGEGRRRRATLGLARPVEAATPQAAKRDDAPARRAGPPAAPAADGSRRLQEAFLDEMIRSQVRLTIYLGSGARVEGVITAHDAHCFLIERNGVAQLVYKSAVATDMPTEPASIPGDREGVARDVGAPAAKAPRKPLVVARPKRRAVAGPPPRSLGRHGAVPAG